MRKFFRNVVYKTNINPDGNISSRDNKLHYVLTEIVDKVKTYQVD